MRWQLALRSKILLGGYQSAAEMVAPIHRRLSVDSMGWVGSTKEGGEEAEIAPVNINHLEDEIKNNSASWSGKVLLIVKKGAAPPPQPGVSGFANGAGRVLKNVAVDDGNEQFFIVARGAPAYGGAEEERKVTDGQRLRMAAIAPIGIEVAQCAVLLTSTRCTAQIRKRSVMSANQAHPR